MPQLTERISKITQEGLDISRILDFTDKRGLIGDKAIMKFAALPLALIRSALSGNQQLLLSEINWPAVGYGIGLGILLEISSRFSEDESMGFIKSSIGPILIAGGLITNHHELTIAGSTVLLTAAAASRFFNKKKAVS